MRDSGIAEDSQSEIRRVGKKNTSLDLQLSADFEHNADGGYRLDIPRSRNLKPRPRLGTGPYRARMMLLPDRQRRRGLEPEAGSAAARSYESLLRASGSL